ncbi:DUF3159 domain-containing protein [Demequina capsici]|uniref:DUF3159 domain-containing protein n=1 Tax=Demequina capsici TaxID=3075620 RepID=A0AA96J8S9_9MICO|nr:MULTISPECIES: DUF3159 domain-containing protein [unclassified Demequina]WNM25710.1 DUF3159 domain-containing protein [Demequina sp. OYTSA14]WNM28605.1 DUF3159 domain-containing protein [Demequina sp. PMTSA13]
MTADDGERQPGLAALLSSEEFSLHQAIGGWRGFAESVAPGLVFVVAFLVWGGFRVPVIASVATVVVLVVARLVGRTPITQALSGVVGVALGAVWAWRAGDAGEYFLPGLWINAAWAAGVLLTMVVRWPLVGVVVALLRGGGMAWRKVPAAMRRYQWGTALLAGMFVLRLLVQVPLYLADRVAVLGTAKLAMGLPLTALTLWAIWFLVRTVERPEEPEAPLPPTR